MKTLPAFAHNEVVEGLQKLLLLRLQGAPPEAAVAYTAQVWLEALATLPVAWEDELDQGRIRRGFARLAADVERWPTPKMLIERLPPRKARLQLDYDRSLSPEEKELAQANLRTLYQIINAKLLKGINNGEKQ